MAAGMIQGTVYERGVPVAGRKMIAVTDTPSGAESVVASTVTAGDGTYTLNTPDQTPVLVISREEYHQVWQPNTTYNVNDAVHSTPTLEFPDLPTHPILSENHSNLELFLRFDDGTVKDYSPIASNGTLSGSSPPVITNNGPTGNAVYFSNPASTADATSYINFSTSRNWGISEPYCLSVWVNMSSIKPRFTIAGDSSMNGYFIVDHVAKNIRVGMRGGSVYVEASDLSPDIWQHIVIARIGGNQIVSYVDGVLQTGTAVYDSDYDYIKTLGTWEVTTNERDDNAIGYMSQVRFFVGLIVTQEMVDALFTEAEYASSYTYVCTTGGTTGATEPEWNTAGDTNDGTVVWQPKPFFQPKIHGPLIPTAVA